MGETIAYIPYVKEKDVSYIEMFFVVELAYRTTGNSSGHDPFLSSSFFIKRFLTV